MKKILNNVTNLGHIGKTNELIDAANQTVETIGTLATKAELSKKANSITLQNYVPIKDKNVNGGVAALTADGHLLLPDGTELW